MEKQARPSSNLKRRHKMQLERHKMFPESLPQGFGSVRSPIQCEGIERGHRRIAEIGVAGSVNPQSFWSDLGSWAVQNAPGIVKGISSFF
jgi:hypothetical protein